MAVIRRDVRRDSLSRNDLPGDRQADPVGPARQLQDALAPLRRGERGETGHRPDYPLSEVPAAIRYMHEGHAHGEIVINVAAPTSRT